MRIRAAGTADIADVLDLWAGARSSGASTRDDEDVVRRLLERDPEALLVAEQDGQVVGTLIAAWDGWRGNMYRLAVAPEHRREGVARRLVSEGERRLKAVGCQRVTALVWREDEPAAGLWSTAGYRDDAGVARFVRNV